MMMITNHIVRLRNTLVLAARQRHAGAHDKSDKAKRWDDKQALRKTVLKMQDEEGGGNAIFSF